MSTAVQPAVEGIPVERLKEIELQRQLAVIADSVAEQGQAVVPEDGRLDLPDAQLNGLLGIAARSLSTAPVVEWLQRQTARRALWQAGDVGYRLITEINQLDRIAVQIANATAEELAKSGARTSAEELQLLDGRGRAPAVHLALLRMLVEAFVARYMFEREKRERNPRRGQR